MVLLEILLPTLLQIKKVTFGLPQPGEVLPNMMVENLLSFPEKMDLSTTMKTMLFTPINQTQYG